MSVATMPSRPKAADVRMALRRYWAAPEAAIVFEVAQATGLAAHRHLDAVAMELWPSRGLALHGVEIKVNLYDWRREKATPEKAEQIARFCDYFWVAAPKGLIPLGEVPTAWGLLELSDGRLIQTKAAQRTEAEPVGRPFLAAMLRAASRTLDADEVQSALDAERKKLEAQFAERVQMEVERRERYREGASEHWTKLVEAVGEDPAHFYDNEDLIAAVVAVRKAGVANTWSGLRTLERSLADAHERVRTACGELGLPDEARQKRRRA